MGNWIAGLSARISVYNALWAELKALLLVLKLASLLKTPKLHIDMDSLKVINIIHNDHHTFTNIIMQGIAPKDGEFRDQP
ncbi:hypothetical protein RDI58_007073 [Solanum bulbocastanum]|uniref:RNase H type-1 domain-containing protein n=1 Tax=Solanum bulbocastanum TaxID=147425 RepID=A0AAN8TUK5_SOLBU